MVKNRPNRNELKERVYAKNRKDANAEPDITSYPWHIAGVVNAQAQNDVQQHMCLLFFDGKSIGLIVFCH